MLKIGVIGCGYWGPNLIRNFVIYPETEVQWVCDLDAKRVDQVLAPYPTIQKAGDIKQILEDETIDGVAIATPVHTHYALTMACLEHGKHVLVEKPLASSVQQGKEMVELAKSKNLQLMVDHTFCYTGAVRKIKDVIATGELGNLLYFDSVRINLGLFQQDINVVWDLAPHDLSILDFLVNENPVDIRTHGVCHAGNNIENIAYVSIGYDNPFIAHFHLNWLSPVKIRKTIICGDEKMLVWDDLEPSEKIKIYDKGINVEQNDSDKIRQLLVSYRSGDMYSPRFSQPEALALVVKEFADSIKENRSPLTDGVAGLRVLQMLESSEKSIKSNGIKVSIDYT